VATSRVTLATLNTLAGLEQEMARTGRVAERQALEAALRAFAAPFSGYLTTGAAAAALGVSIPTVKRWVRRGALRGVRVGGRWLVSQESVDQARGVSLAAAALDHEGTRAPEAAPAPLDRAPAAAAIVDQPACRKHTTTLELWLRVEHNNTFVRGKTRARQDIEDFHLRRYALRKLGGWEYELTVRHDDDADLDEQVEELLREIEHEAELRHCFIEADVRERGTERSW
jgi:excisionase family DNA binding protein